MADISGLKLIIPSSVSGSGVSVSASGKVTFTDATRISVNGCFDSTYDNYLVIAKGGLASGTDGLAVRLRNSETDDSGSNYTQQSLNVDDTTVSGARSSNTFFRSGNFDSLLPSGIHLYIYGSNLSQPTVFRSITVYSSGGSVAIRDFSGTHSLSSSYDGFTCYPESSNITGSLTIYGLNQ